MSRLCRLKTASHGDDGKWAYDEIVSLRKQRDELLSDLAEVKRSAEFNFEQYQDVGRLLHEECEKTEKLLSALEFYAEGHHFILHDANAWETVSGEPQNFQEDEANTATVEDGSVAKYAIASVKGEQ